MGQPPPEDRLTPVSFRRFPDLAFALVVKNVKLTTVEQRETARRAQWYLEVNLGRFTQDSVVYTGDGVDDLDRVISRIASGTQPGASLLMDVASVGVPTGQYPIYRPFDLEDLTAIRNFYIGFYGTVNKPDAYTASPPVNLEVIAWGTGTP